MIEGWTLLLPLVVVVGVACRVILALIASIRVVLAALTLTLTISLTSFHELEALSILHRRSILKAEANLKLDF